MNKVVLGDAFLWLFRFSPVSIIPPAFCTHSSLPQSITDAVSTYSHCCICFCVSLYFCNIWTIFSSSFLLFLHLSLHPSFSEFQYCHSNCIDLYTYVLSSIQFLIPALQKRHLSFHFSLFYCLFISLHLVLNIRHIFFKSVPSLSKQMCPSSFLNNLSFRFLLSHFGFPTCLSVITAL